jgi:hypothetical protein
MVLLEEISDVSELIGGRCSQKISLQNAGVSIWHMVLLEEASGVSGVTCPKQVPLKMCMFFLHNTRNYWRKLRTFRTSADAVCYFKRFQAFPMICDIAGRSFRRFGGRQVDGHEMLFWNFFFLKTIHDTGTQQAWIWKVMFELNNWLTTRTWQMDGKYDLTKHRYLSGTFFDFIYSN